MDKFPKSLDLTAMQAHLSDQSGQRLWRSLEELADAPEVRRHMEAEFPDVAQAGSLDRRTLLRLMGASLALSGLAACNDTPKNAPLLSQPRNRPGYVPGNPLFFATTLELDGYGRGAIVKVQDGRPIKIEGNPLHPASLGATDVFMQAEVLSLYDPDRTRSLTRAGKPVPSNDLASALKPVREALAESEGSGLHILMQPHASPTTQRLIQALKERMPQTYWYAYSPISESHRREGALRAFGAAYDCIYDFKSADTIVTFGGDLFSSDPGSIRYAADYQARRRDAAKPLPKLYSIESCPSLVGARADERVSLRPREIEGFARSLLRALDGAFADNLHPSLKTISQALLESGSRSIVYVGRDQAPEVHALAHAINHRLGSVGTSVRMVDPVQDSDTDFETIEVLSKRMMGGTVSRLLILGGNPAYDAPADLAFGQLIRHIPLSVYLGYHYNNTSAACQWHVPQSHILESFGDLRAFDGSIGLRQPATTKLAPSFSIDEFLALLLDQPAESLRLVQETWRNQWGGSFETGWAQALENGLVADTAHPPVRVSLQDDWDRPADNPNAPYEIVFSPDATLWDGRFANNGWLQELPHPLTKQAWGNAALIAPETAGALNLKNGDVIEIATDHASLAAPVWILPGHATDTVTLPLGYGQLHAGSLGGGIGFDAYKLRTTKTPWRIHGTIKPLGTQGRVISTQQHHGLNSNDIIRTVTPARPVIDDHSAPQPSLYPEWKHDGYAWGMAVDLDACIGCNACTIACQAENNVAVVGPEEVARGREMHWLRIDRYYAGDPINPETYFQPVPCMHCENAPCEVVCPVNATVHSAEGLNDMVYNRCVGTRTCSNNCPYKVRRFNFLDYRNVASATSMEAMNPQVTIRDRGVMEKCTFCVQRISEARINARMEDREVADGEIRTACQQACPTQAITFGNVNDPDSAVSRLKSSDRNYALLGNLNTRPRTTYLAKVEQDQAALKGG